MENLEEELTQKLNPEWKIKICSSKEKGRYVVATENLKRGSLVYEGNPYATVVRAKYFDIICHNCFLLPQKQATFPTCATCRRPRYCSKECQKQAWKIHKRECAYWTKHFKDGLPPPPFQLIIRVVLQKLLDEQSKTTTSPNYEDLKALVTHWENRDEEKHKQFVKYAHDVCKVLELDDVENNPSLLKEIAELFSMVPCNEFGIFNAITQHIGHGLYPTAAFFNHSCAPNCISSFEGRTLRIRTIDDVSAGTELCFAYVDINEPTSVRKSLLLKDYFFNCTCTKCMLPPEKSFDRFLTGYRCKNETCTEPLEIDNKDNNSELLVCKQCKFSIQLSELQSVENQAKQLYDQGIETWEKSSKEAAQKLLMECYKMRQEIYHKYNKTLHDTRMMLANVLTTRDSLIYLEQSIEFLQTSGHPFQVAISFASFMVASLVLFWIARGEVDKESVDELHLKAYNALKRAHKGYSVTHGSSHPYVKNVEKYLIETERVCKRKGLLKDEATP